MPIRHWLVSIALTGVSASLSPAQTDPRAVQPERPTVATHAGTVAPGFLEIEAGGQWDRFDDGSLGMQLPMVFKFGVSRSVQLSIFTAFVSPPVGSSAIGDAGVGVKWRFVEHHPALGRFAIFPSVKFPTGTTASGTATGTNVTPMGSGTGTGTTDFGLLLISSRMLGPVALDLNAGYTRRTGGDAGASGETMVWTISTGGPWAGPVGWVVELFGYPKTGIQPSSAALLFGPTLVVKPWLSLDAGAIVPVSGSPPKSWYLGGVWNVGRYR
jgi:hypothetical protein